MEHDIESVLQHMRTEKKSKVVFTTEQATTTWEFIPVSQCRDYDGTLAGWNDRPGETVLQKIYWPVDGFPRYTNYWNASL
jgi:hypothetical protein